MPSAEIKALESATPSSGEVHEASMIRYGFRCSAAVDCRARAALRLAKGDDQRAVRLGNVPHGALGVPAAGKLAKRVTLGNRPILRQPPWRTPAAEFHVGSERRIERTAIDAGLAS